MTKRKRLNVFIEKQTISQSFSWKLSVFLKAYKLESHVFLSILAESIMASKDANSSDNASRLDHTVKGLSNNVKVALVNPPLIEKVYHHPFFPPLGLAYLAAVLEQRGFEVNIYDCPVLEMNQKNLRNKLSDFQPDFVGIASMTPTIPSALQSARVAKEACPNCRVILGGPHVSFADKEVLTEEKSVDIVVRGEGEETLLEIVQQHQERRNLIKVSGITFRYDDQIIRCTDRPFIQNLDSLPFPAYHYLPIEKYRIYGKRFLPIMTSRGCPFQCSFCVASQMFGAKFRARTPKNVVDELEWLKEKYGADGVSFHDDTLTLDKQRIIRICDEIINRKIGLPWGCQTRVDTVDREVLSKMRKANCNEVSFGVESGCQRILDAVKKRISIEQCEKAIKMAKEEGLFVAVSTIIGYPGETQESIIQTLDLIRRIEPDDAWLCIATPYPGTELRALIESMGWKISNDWTLYNTMNPVFENPRVSSDQLSKIRRVFYDNLYTPKYVFRQFVKGYIRGNFYSKIMTRTAMNYIIWKNTKD